MSFSTPEDHCLRDKRSHSEEGSRWLNVLASDDSFDVGQTLSIGTRCPPVVTRLGGLIWTVFMFQPWRQAQSGNT